MEGWNSSAWSSAANVRVLNSSLCAEMEARALLKALRSFLALWLSGEAAPGIFWWTRNEKATGSLVVRQASSSAHAGKIKELSARSETIAVSSLTCMHAHVHSSPSETLTSFVSVPVSSSWPTAGKESCQQNRSSYSFFLLATCN